MQGVREGGGGEGGKEGVRDVGQGRLGTEIRPPSSTCLPGAVPSECSLVTGDEGVRKAWVAGKGEGGRADGEGEWVEGGESWLYDTGQGWLGC